MKFTIHKVTTYKGTGYDYDVDLKTRATNVN